MIAPTLAYDCVQHCVVLVHDANPPGAEEFTAYIEFLREQSDHLDSILIVSEGGAPDAAQRKQLDSLASLHARSRMHTAVVTSSAAARMVVNLVSWSMNARIRSFRPLDLPVALAYIRLPIHEQAGVIATVNRLRKSINLPALGAPLAAPRPVQRASK